jgi:hypothetical protein
MPDPVNNETGSLGDGRTPSEQPTNSPAAGGTRQNTQYHQSGQPDGSRATAEGGMSSNATPLHTDGGNAQHTGAPARIDAGGAQMPGVYASGMPIWTETLESVQATPEKIIQSLEERGYLMPLGGSESSPLPGAEQAQNPDAPQASKIATGPSAEPGAGDKAYHWWFRPFGGK